MTHKTHNDTHLSSARASRRMLLKAGGAGLLLSALPVSQAQVVSMNDAINKAGRQRMLSQRLSKAWLAVGQGVEVKRAERVLQDSMALFDRQLVELKAFAPTPEIKATYVSLDAAWGEYKTALVGTAPSQSAAPSLITLDNRVLQLANQGATQLEKHSGQSVGRLVNIAGRQRMLSQRTAKYFLAQSWKAPVSTAKAEVDNARAEFVQALKVLHDAPEANASIRGDLDLAQQQWVFFENAMERGTDGAVGSARAAQVFGSSEILLELMDRITAQYARLSA
ncbi:type IV pili methyl-accepting chemotaxis transducer N-terminal domain-containing protein [Caldimonas tepidiphila]|uniref:type IV pili methyl-accepting chemotaxis transducer N-terminal domain-containing protein n=1 Tax=Caldimonas tepidiphila TaxID=2315841 RepID=UPI001F0C861B|nr:type IV pili methyl-accepting chemotaxis transducer N-terminal domain-containing protein [Caldimonas tepidiphila]